VREVLHARLAYLEREANVLKQTKRPEYHEDYGVIARYLAHLGDEVGKAAAERYRSYDAWAKRRPM